MIGAIIGDICGSPYEFIDYKIPYDFPLLSRGSTPTDDTVMTIAVADALITCINSCDIYDEKIVKKTLVSYMQRYGRKYPHAGYGGRFINWIFEENPEPYGSFGNGSAMRVSSVGWLFDDLETTRKIARWTAEVTHNHPEAIKGAQCTAEAIYLARTGCDMVDIWSGLKKAYDYNTIDMPTKDFISCQSTMPICIRSLMDSNDFESAIRRAISFGYDTDTYGAITGSMAEAYYGIESDLTVDILDKYLPDEFLDVIDEFAKIRRKPNRGLRELY